MSGALRALENQQKCQKTVFQTKIYMLIEKRGTLQSLGST